MTGQHVGSGRLQSATEDCEVKLNQNTRMEGSTVRVKWLSQDHDTMTLTMAQTWTVSFKVQRANKSASIISYLNFKSITSEIIAC